MSDISAFGFSDPDLQRLTYSKYYNGNVLKGGVGVQLCGLIVTADLWGICNVKKNLQQMIWLMVRNYHSPLSLTKAFG